MYVVALLAVYNEERFISGCIEHLAKQGVHVYLIDNQSTDATVQIAKSYKEVIGIETIPRDGTYRWRSILQRKEELASSLDADWFMHVDADERHISPTPELPLVEALHHADKLGFSAVEFQEFTFVPTLESPNHNHPEFEKTMRNYYHFSPGPLHLMRAWKKQGVRVDISSSGGHRVVSPEMRVYPMPFLMRHYLYLSKEHVVEKYLKRRFDEQELRDGWHGWRAKLSRDAITLPTEKILQTYLDDGHFDVSTPWKRHWFDITMQESLSCEIARMQLS